MVEKNQNLLFPYMWEGKHTLAAGNNGFVAELRPTVVNVPLSSCFKPVSLPILKSCFWQKSDFILRMNARSAGIIWEFPSVHCSESQASLRSLDSQPGTQRTLTLICFSALCWCISKCYIHKCWAGL